MRPVIALLALCLSLLAASPCRAGQGEDQALASYHEGIAAKTMGQREDAFEKALELYLAQYNRMKEDGAVNGLLCYNIGNCYFNLGQNEEAIFYYQLARKLLPLNKNIAANLKMAQDKRTNAQDMGRDGLLATILFFHFKLSAATQIKILMGTATATALALFWLLYMNGAILIRYLAILSGLTALSLCISLAADYYTPTHLGILMRTADVRRGPGEGFAPITPKPLGGGSSLTVISLEDGWYTVQLNDGHQGFLPEKDLKLVIL